MGEIKKIIKNSLVLYGITYNFLKILSYFISDEKYIRIKYKLKFKKNLNLKNPQTFTEKIQWRILNDKNDIYTELTDKLLVRKYIEEKIGKEYLIKLLGVYEKVEDIDYEKLPNKFVLKCNHDSGSVIICKDKLTFNKKESNKKLEFFLKKNYYYQTREIHYKNIKPLIICEEFLEENNEAPIDYKYHCIHNNIEFIQVDIGRFNNHERNNFDKNWKLSAFIFGPKEYKFNNNFKRLEKPKSFKKMKELAIKVSKDFDYCRVDFYEVNGKVYFGEITFTPGGGMEVFSPIEWDCKLGKLWKIK